MPSKYRSYTPDPPPIPREPAPVWRGIGCLMLVIIPVIAWILSTLLVELAPSYGISLPPELLGPPAIPSFLFQVPGLVGLLSWIQRQNNLYAILLGTFLLSVLLMGLVALGYSFLYRLFGPPRYGPLDVPPPKVKARKYRR